MSRSIVNLGILAHVDAGKTSLTERLLFAAGVIDAVGSVDRGTTRTDTLAFERQRGITIKSAVAAFAIGDVKVNLIDTPGHPDFIAEVQRVLNVLDGAVLVVSAVEGVQPQTLLLMRALGRLAIPTLLFVNKIDRAGAGEERVLQAIRERLTPAIVALGTTEELGTRAAAFRPADPGDAGFRARLAAQLAEHDDAILAAFVADETELPYARLRLALGEQTRRSLVHPVFFGSAITGAGVDALQAGIAELLPAAAGDPGGPVAASVFKIERVAGEKVAYARMFSGTVRARDRVRLGDGLEAKVTAIRVFDDGAARQQPSVAAGEIAKLWGLGGVRIGDRLGDAGAHVAAAEQFAPPTLESVVDPCDPDDRPRLRVALLQLAEQDPLIDIRQNDRSREISVSLYGEVQKEVVEATLANDYGLAVSFREATPIYVERPTGSGESLALLHAEGNPFRAELGLRVEPAEPGRGIELRIDVPTGSLPLFIYKTVETFTASLDRTIRETLQEGLFGWQVADCSVTLVECAWSVADGPPSRRGETSTPNDYRRLTPIVVMRALADAGTAVCQPMLSVRIDTPADSLGAVVAAVARLDGSAGTPSVAGAAATVAALLPAAHAHDLQRRLAALTHGEGALETSFGGYEPIAGEPPIRERTTPNPLNLDEYLMHLARRVSGQ